MKFINEFRKHWHFVVLAIFCLTPVLWFMGKDPNVLINGLDTNFPLNPLVWFTRRLFVWNSIINAGVDFSSSTAGLFFHLIQLIPYSLGLSLKFVEILSMIFWFSAVVISSYMLAKTVVPKSKTAQIVFVAIYSFNIYLFNTWENVKVANLALVASLPLFVLVVHRWVNGAVTAKRAFLLLCLTGILASGSGINPAYFSVIVLVILIEGVILGKVKIPFLAVLTLLAVNLFWILPLANFLLTNQSRSLESLGLTNWLNSLSENTSITNIVRLQGAWDWYALDKFGMPQYLPYTLNYLYKYPFVIFSFAVPFLSFASFLFVNSKKRFWYLFFGVLAFLGIFLGVGSHAPTGGIFVFFYNHIPFLSFFRSPWYIFTPLLIISYAGLSGLLFEELLTRFSKKTFGFLIGFFGFLFLILYGIYNYPLVTGKIFRPDKDGFYVKFPDYLWDSQKWLAESRNEDDYRLISYPDDNLESFSWGYKGTESILSLFSDREIVAPSFNIPSKPFAFLLNDFYSHMKRKEYASAISVLNFFGSDTIFYKKDSPTLSPAITNEIGKFVNTTSFGEWAFMKLNNEINKKIYLPGTVYNNLSYPDESIFQVPLLVRGAAIVNGTIDSEIAEIPGSEKYLMLAKAYGLEEANDELGNVKEYGFTVPKDGFFDFAIESLYVNKNDIVLKIDDKDVSTSLARQDDAFIRVGPINLKKGTHILRVSYPVGENLLDVGDFSQYIEDLNLRREALPADPRKTLVAINSEDKEKVIKLPVRNFNPFIRYGIGYDYQYIYGSVPILDVIQSAPTAPVKTHPDYPGSSMDWELKYEIFRPVETDSKLELLIRMPPNNPGDRSKAYFENIFVRRIYDNQVFVIERNQESTNLSTKIVEFRKVSPVKYEVSIKGSNDDADGTLLVFLESYNRGWVMKSEDNKIAPKPSHFTVNGYANGWYIPESSDGSNYVIYYKPQNLYVIGGIVSLLTLLSASILEFIRWRKQ